MDPAIQAERIQHASGHLDIAAHRWGILYIRTGNGDFQYSHHRYPLAPHRIFLLQPAPQQPIIHWRGSAWLISFEDGLLRAFFRQYPREKVLPLFLPGSTPYVDIDPVLGLELNILLFFIRQQHLTGANGKIAAAYLQAFLLHLANAYHLANNIPAGRVHYETAEKLLGLIRTHFKTERLSPFYAGQLGLPFRKLNAIAKSATGKLVTELVTDQLLAEAEQLLAESPLTIKEIAYELDFADMAQFNHFIKRHTGLSPSEFRRQVQADK